VARRLTRHVHTGVNVSLGDFANKALAELAAGRVLEAECTLNQNQTFAEQDKRTNLLLSLSVVQWLNGHAE
jgi:hypothetical protein